MRGVYKQFGMVAALVCTAIVIGCEWEGSGDSDSWNSDYDWVNFSGVYRGPGNGILVADFSSEAGAGLASGGGAAGSLALGATVTTNVVTVQNENQDEDGDGVNSSFSGTLVNDNIVPQSVTINAGGFSLKDNGLGVLSGVNCSGTIEYGTGAWSIDLQGVPLANNQKILASYQYYKDTVVSDVDGDGVPDTTDNCPTVANAGQQDADGDGVGNACDADSGTGDLDGDGVPDTLDNCIFVSNSNQSDVDGDGVGDSCDPIDNRLDPGSSGRTIYSFTVFQTGNKLEITDNNGAKYVGRMGSVSTTTGNDGTGTTIPSVGDQAIAEYTAEGTSAAGVGVMLTGTFQGVVGRGSGTDMMLTTRRMLGTWVESSGVTGSINGESAPITISTPTATQPTDTTATTP